MYDAVDFETETETETETDDTDDLDVVIPPITHPGDELITYV